MKRFRIQIMYSNKPGVWDEFFTSADTQAEAKILLEKAEAVVPNQFRILEYDTTNMDDTFCRLFHSKGGPFMKI